MFVWHFTTQEWGWVGRVAICIGEHRFWTRPNSVLPALRGENKMWQMQGYAIPFLKYMKCNVWTNAKMQKTKSVFPLDITLVRRAWKDQRERFRTSAVMSWAVCFSFVLDVFCLSLRWCMLFSPLKRNVRRECEVFMFMHDTYTYLCTYSV